MVGWGHSLVNGHDTDETYIWLNAQSDRFDGRIEFRLPDLRQYLNMELPTDFDAARKAVIGKKAELTAYAQKHFKLAGLALFPFGKVIR